VADNILAAIFLTTLAGRATGIVNYGDRHLTNLGIVGGFVVMMAGMSLLG